MAYTLYDWFKDKYEALAIVRIDGKYLLVPAQWLRPGTAPNTEMNRPAIPDADGWNIERLLRQPGVIEIPDPWGVAR